MTEQSKKERLEKILKIIYAKDQETLKAITGMNEFDLVAIKIYADHELDAIRNRQIARAKKKKEKEQPKEEKKEPENKVEYGAFGPIFNGNPLGGTRAGNLVGSLFR